MTYPIVITGRGAVSGFGVGLAALDAGVRAGITALRPVRRFSTEGLDSELAALVPGFDSPAMAEKPSPRTLELAVEWALRAGEEALGGAPSGRIGLVLGSNLEDRPHSLGELLVRVGDGLDLQGPRLLLSTACSSSTAVFRPALDWLRSGQVDAVLVGGTDVISPRLYAGFHVLGVLARKPCTPFGSRYGLSLGEGAGFVLLERADGASARDATIYGQIAGAGTSADGHHLTRPAPHGAGVRAAIETALADGGVPSEAVVYVNAHGTGTEANDGSEARGVAEALGPVPVSSSKHLIGHAQGAAGILELLITLLAEDHGALPPTWGLQDPRPGAPEDPIAESTLRPAPAGPRISTNSGFGGSNAAVLTGAGRPESDRRSVFLGTPAVLAPEAELGPVTRGSLPPRARRKWEPRVDPRQADPSTLGLIGAARRAARQLRGAERIGLVTGQLRGSERQVEDLGRSIDQHGLRRLKGAAFARSLLVAPSGMTAAELGLHGPMFVLCAGGASGLCALIHAAEAVASGRSPAMIAASTDEPTIDQRKGAHWEGAVGLPLSAQAAEVRISGWAVAAPEDLDEAVARACDQLPEPVPRFEVDAAGAASEGLLAVARAHRALLADECRHAVAIARSEGQICAAIALTRDD